LPISANIRKTSAGRKIMTLEERRKSALSQEEAGFPSKSVFVFKKPPAGKNRRPVAPLEA